MRMRGVALVASVGLSLALGPSAVATSAGPGRLVVTGSRTASMTWHLSTYTTLNIDTWWWKGLPDGAVRRTGHVGGVVISQGRQVIAGVVQDGDVHQALVFGEGHPTLPAGDYTVTLVADAAVTVTLPLTGSLGTSRLHPLRPVAMHRTSMSAMPAAPAPAVYAMAPVVVGKRTMVIVSDQIDGTAVGQNNNLCLSTRSEPCAAAELDGSGQGGQDVSAGGTSSTGAAFFYPGDVRPGGYWGGVDQATVGLVHDARLVVLDVSL